MSGFSVADLIQAYSKDPVGKYEMQDATVSYMQANSVCGDEIVVFLKTSPLAPLLGGEWDFVVEERSWWGEPAMQTVAGASMLAEVIIGKRISDVMSRDYEFMKELGLEMSPRRRRSVVTALLATHNAVRVWKGEEVKGYESVI